MNPSQTWRESLPWSLYLHLPVGTDSGAVLVEILGSRIEAFLEHQRIYFS
jgi:hypothetical protein